MLRPGTPEHSSLFSSLLPLSIIWLRCSPGLCPFLLTVKHTFTHMRAMSSSSQGLASTGLALGAGPTLPLHQSSQSAGRGSDADRSRCLYPPPLPSSSNASRGWASKRTKQGSERKERSRRRGLDEHCCDIVLESELSVFFSFFAISFFCENG